MKRPIKRTPRAPAPRKLPLPLPDEDEVVRLYGQVSEQRHILRPCPGDVGDAICKASEALEQAAKTAGCAFVEQQGAESADARENSASKQRHRKDVRDQLLDALRIVRIAQEVARREDIT